MRQISVLLVPLLVALLQGTAHAGMHTGPTRGPTVLGLLAVIITILVLRGFIIRILGAGAPCALFVAVGSVATALLVQQYALIFAYVTGLAQSGVDLVIILIVNFVVLVVMLVWAAPCCLKKPISWMDAVNVIWIPALVPVLYALLKPWLLAFLGRFL